MPPHSCSLTLLPATQCVFDDTANAVVPASTVRVAIGLQSENNSTGVDLGNVNHIVVHRKFACAHCSWNKAGACFRS